MEGELLIPGGYALCVVDLTACRRDGGGYAWSFKNIREIQPFKVKGKQKLFEVDYEFQSLSDEFEDHLQYFELLTPWINCIKKKKAFLSLFHKKTIATTVFGG
jgi:hypothetical protein